MTDFLKPTIASASFALTFVEPIRNMAANKALAEEVFSEFTNASAQLTDLPENDLSAARIMFQTNRKSVLISSVGCQLDFSFSDNSSEFSKQFDIFEKNTQEFYSLASRRFCVGEFGLSACMMDVHFPTSLTNEAAQKYLLDRLVTSPLSYPVASMQLALGFEVDGHFVNFSAQVYETRTIEVKPGQSGVSQVRHFRVNDMKVDERGLSFRFDVNNRPTIAAGNFVLAADAGATLGQLKKFLVSDFTKLTELSLYD